MLEIVAAEIGRRFNQSDLEIIKGIEQLSIKASNDEPLTYVTMFQNSWEMTLAVLV